MSSPDDPPKPDQPSDAPVEPSPSEPSPSEPPDYQPVDPSTGQPLPESRTSVSGSGTSGSGTSGSGTSGPTVVIDDAILPATLGDTALHDAVGVKARRRRPDTDDRDDDGHEPTPRVRSRRTIVVATTSILLGLLVATLVFLGRANAQRYIIKCTSTQVTAEQGRGFPPWGTHPLTAPEWKPIVLPSVAECKPRETEDLDELGKWYLDMLVDRATAILTARNVLEPQPAPTAGAQPTTNPIDLAAAELEQALLLARNPDRRDQRKDVERLLGDVEYWRASARLREVSNVLLEAAKQFDAAAAQRPRHVSDAAAWATYVRKLADELHAGPAGATAAATTAPAAAAPPVTAPPGVALPVEPVGSDSGSAAPPPAPDAGVPSGGVLL